MSDLFQTLQERLRIRAKIRREIPTRKSVQLNQRDRLADLLEEAANHIDRLEAFQTAAFDAHPNLDLDIERYI